jgi:DNA-binding NtrC family response regulator
MEQHTVLYISGRAGSNNSVLHAIKEAGCDVVRRNSPTEGVALLYILGKVAAVVLDSCVREQAGFDVAQSLRRIRPSVPLMLECDQPADSSLVKIYKDDDGSSHAKCNADADRLSSALEHLLNQEAVA